MRDLVLIRGLPGAGKSTAAKDLFSGALEVCADYWFDYFCEGKFNPKLLAKAHKWCLEEARRGLLDGNTVVVHNTFTREWEMEQYFDLASVLKVRVWVFVAENRHGGKSVHNVPQATIDNMRSRFQIKL